MADWEVKILFGRCSAECRQIWWARTRGSSGAREGGGTRQHHHPSFLALAAAAADLSILRLCHVEHAAAGSEQTWVFGRRRGRRFGLPHSVVLMGHGPPHD